MEKELIKFITNEEGKQLVSLRELYGFLEVTERFSSWFNRMTQYGFMENQDYTSIKSFAVVNNGAKKEIQDYAITLDMAIEICMIQKTNKKAGEMLNYLIKDIKVLIKHTYSRFEISFGDQLKQTLKPLNIKIETQKSMFNGKYRIDFYLPEFNLAIEYDEGHHKYQQEEDKQREEEIKSCLHCEFIRLDYKQDDCYNVGLVLKKIFNR